MIDRGKKNLLGVAISASITSTLWPKSSKTHRAAGAVRQPRWLCMVSSPALWIALIAIASTRSILSLQMVSLCVGL